MLTIPLNVRHQICCKIPFEQISATLQALEFYGVH